MSGQPTEAQKQQYLQQVKQQAQVQMMQELSAKMTEKCFKLCAGKKGERLDSSESQCVVHCMDRYMDAMQVVTQALEAQQNK